MIWTSSAPSSVPAGVGVGRVPHPGGEARAGRDGLAEDHDGYLAAARSGAYEAPAATRHSTGLLQRPADLGRGQPEVEGYQDGARLQGTEEHLPVLRGVAVDEATRSPGRTPAAISAFATRLAARSSSANVTDGRRRRPRSPSGSTAPPSRSNWATDIVPPLGRSGARRARPMTGRRTAGRRRTRRRRAMDWLMEPLSDTSPASASGGSARMAKRAIARTGPATGVRRAEPLTHPVEDPMVAGQLGRGRVDAEHRSAADRVEPEQHPDLRRAPRRRRRPRGRPVRCCDEHSCATATGDERARASLNSSASRPAKTSPCAGSARSANAARRRCGRSPRRRTPAAVPRLSR